jgi:hypothetical protein
MLLDFILCAKVEVSNLLKLAARSRISIALSSLPTASSQRGDSGITLQQNFLLGL